MGQLLQQAAKLRHPEHQVSSLSHRVPVQHMPSGVLFKYAAVYIILLGHPSNGNPCGTKPVHFFVVLCHSACRVIVVPRLRVVVVA